MLQNIEFIRAVGNEKLYTRTKNSYVSFRVLVICEEGHCIASSAM